MQWSDEGIVLTVRRHGEAAFLLSVLTVDHGRHAGLVRGRGGRGAGAPQPGSEVALVWRGRLAEHLGTFTVETSRLRAAALFDDPHRLAGLAAALAVVETALPEREPHPAVHRALAALLDALQAGDESWPAAYVRWELGLLAELGFGLDLSRCAVTGGNERLTHVSPRTGRAVSAEPAEPWRNRLLALPAFLAPGGADALDDRQVRDGLALTGHFLERHVLAPQGHREPAARQRLAQRFVRSTDQGCHA